MKLDLCRTAVILFAIFITYTLILKPNKEGIKFSGNFDKPEPRLCFPQRLFEDAIKRDDASIRRSGVKRLGTLGAAAGGYAVGKALFKGSSKKYFPTKSIGYKSKRGNFKF